MPRMDYHLVLVKTILIEQPQAYSDATANKSKCGSSVLGKPLG
jgi:hypothetical protein